MTEFQCDPDLIRVILMMAQDNAGLREGEFNLKDLPQIRRHFAELIACGYARGLIIRGERGPQYAELFALTPVGQSFAAAIWSEAVWGRVRSAGEVPLEVLAASVAAVSAGRGSVA